jgi:hypothetical protein
MLHSRPFCACFAEGLKLRKGPDRRDRKGALRLRLRTHDSEVGSRSEAYPEMRTTHCALTARYWAEDAIVVSLICVRSSACRRARRAASTGLWWRRWPRRGNCRPIMPSNHFTAAAVSPPSRTPSWGASESFGSAFAGRGGRGRRPDVRWLPIRLLSSRCLHPANRTSEVLPRVAAPPLGSDCVPCEGAHQLQCLVK